MFNIKSKLKSLLIRTAFFKNLVSQYQQENFQKVFYGQKAEDFVMHHEMPNKEEGFYVDIGAYHPQKYSNTYIFYSKGWKGINIDANKSAMSLFNEKRPRDINLEVCISDKNEFVTYYDFDVPARNTISDERAKQLQERFPNSLKHTYSLKCSKLSDILDEHLPIGTEIDFFNIDVEEMELSVLKTNNWDKYKPRYIIIESLVSRDRDILEINTDPTIKFLLEKEYFIVGKVAAAIFLKLK